MRDHFPLSTVIPQELGGIFLCLSLSFPTVIFFFFNNQSDFDKRIGLMMKLPCFHPFLGSPVLRRQLQPSPWPRHPAALAPEASPSLSR